jgi:CheY-like chemotaxis protein
LLVDDNDDNRKLYAEQLRTSGWVVEDLTNGLDALQVAPAFAPDVIVMDLAMPVVNGVEVTRRLKRDPRTRDIPIVALTAHPTLLVEAKDAGCSQCLTKPLAPRALLQALTDLLDERRRPPADR